jgi:hypothetical protein
MLLVSLLKAIGIEAKPVLTLTSDNGSIHTIFPNWNFNRMIVKASTTDKKDFWMDPTIKNCKLGSLPYECENINVLVLNDDETSQIEATPGSSAADNVKNLYMKMDLTNIDTAYIDISFRFKGEYDIKYKNSLSEKTHDELLKFCKSLVSDKYLNAEVLDYSISNLDSINSDLKLNFRLRIPNILEKQADLIFLNADAFPILSNWEWLSKEDRTYDIKFDYPYTVKKTIEIVLPENKYFIKNLPTSTVSAEQGINYSRNINSIGNNLIIENEIYSITDTKIKAQNYKTVKEYFDNLKNKLDEKIILTAK